MLTPNKNSKRIQVSNTVIYEQSSFSDQSNQQNNMKTLPNIKVNQNKIMAYAPLGQSNRNHSFHSTNKYVKDHNNSKEKSDTKMIKSSSINNFKHVVQRLNQSYSARVKTELQKENELKTFMPNKTLSNHELKQAYSIQRQINKHRYFDKQKNKGKLQQSVELHNLSQIEVPSKNKTSRQDNKIVSVLASMSKKQQYINEQKAKYESKIRQLKAKILQEKMLLGSSKKNYQKALNQISQKEQQGKQFNNQSLTSAKKRQNIEIQLKLLRGQTVDTSLQNNHVVNQIAQQKQLIDNYIFIIQELKQQLKVQTQEKLQIQKKLTVLKKSEKIHALKRVNQANNTQDLIRTVYSSLKKWQ